MLKRFEFFSRSLVTSDGIALDHRALSPSQSSHEAFLQDDFTCCVGGGGRFAMGDARGGVTLMGAMSLKPRRFVLLETGEPIAAMALTAENLLVVSASSQVRVFRLAGVGTAGSDADDRPRQIVSQIHGVAAAWRKRAATPLAPTCIALSKDFQRLAIGYRDGSLLWLSSNNFREERPNEDASPLWLGTTPSGGACTGLGFTADGSSLWGAFERKLVVFNYLGMETVLDREEGCRTDCACVAPDPSFFVLGKKDRVAFYTTETPGSCYSILGDREKVTKCRDNIVVVSSGEIWKGVAGFDGFASSSSSTSSTARKTGDKGLQSSNGVGATTTEPKKQTVQILDLTNKFVAHEFQLWRDGGDACAFMAADDDTGCVFVLTRSKRRLWRIQEKPIEVKLNDLLKRNLYATAAALAKQSGCEPGFVADIYRKYGDHLYEKGNFDDSVAQFILTIGRVEPSRVIRKFLDAPRVKNLTAYLEALHRYGATSSSTDNSHVPARLFLSDSNAQPIPSADHTTLLLTCYAKLKEEDKITHLLESEDVRIDVDAALAVLKETNRIRPALKLAKERNREDWYVRTLLELSDKDSLEYARTALEFIQAKDRVSVFKSHGSRLMGLLPKESLACVRAWIDRHVAKAEDVLECLADYPHELEALCKEAIMASEDGEDSSSPPPQVWNTCLELALSHGEMDSAFEVLTHPRANYDGNEALAMVRRFKFRKGELFLHERAQRWDLLLQCRMDQGDSDDLILSLAKSRLHSDADAWMNILRHFSSLPFSPQRDTAIKETLRHIDANNVLPPLLALRVLSEQKGNGINLGIVRQYLIGQIQRATKQAQDDQREVKELREDTERMRREARALTTEPKVFNATTCCMTGAPLELPVVHFMSGNSYNLSSLPSPSSASGDRYEDPKCVQDQNAVFDIRRGLAKRRVEVDEEFFSDLQMAKGGEDGFRVVADYFGKCLFDDDDEDDDRTNA